jgi:prepilin-type processing-associated H-X9-DG protein
VKGSQIFTCPSATGYANATGTNYPVTYGCNRNLMKWASGAKLASVVAPAERIIIAEHNGTDWCAYASNETNPPNIYMTVNNTINPRHLGGSNLIFCDGHAKWFIAGGDVNPTNLW